MAASLNVNPSPYWRQHPPGRADAAVTRTSFDGQFQLSRFPGQCWWQINSWTACRRLWFRVPLSTHAVTAAGTWFCRLRVRTWSVRSSSASCQSLRLTCRRMKRRLICGVVSHSTISLGSVPTRLPAVFYTSTRCRYTPSRRIDCHYWQTCAFILVPAWTTVYSVRGVYAVNDRLIRGLTSTDARGRHYHRLERTASVVSKHDEGARVADTSYVDVI